METQTRSAIITAVNNQTVTVTFEREEACSACAARSICHTGACAKISTEVKVKNPSAYHIGQKVFLTVSEKSAVFAVLTAYALPLALTLAGLFVPLAAGAAEDTAAFCALALPALYYLLLFFLRRRIGTKIKIKLQ